MTAGPYSPVALVDFAAILPSLDFIGTLGGPSATAALRPLRLFRLLRLLRLIESEDGSIGGMENRRMSEQARGVSALKPQMELELCPG